MYLDTSALAKLYIVELGSQRMRALASPDAGNRFALCAISKVEFHSAIRRRQRAGDLTDDEADRALERFELHLTSSFLRQEVNDEVIDLASDLTARHSLRAYDAVQLAGCLALRSVSQEPLVFVCADRALLRAAEAEGLATLNPED